MIFYFDSLSYNFLAAGFDILLRLFVFQFYLQPLQQRCLRQHSRWCQGILITALWTIQVLLLLGQRDMPMLLNMALGSLSMLLYILLGKIASLAEAFFYMIVYSLTKDCCKTVLIDLIFPILEKYIPISWNYLVFYAIGLNVLMWLIFVLIRKRLYSGKRFGNGVRYWIVISSPIIPYMLIKGTQYYYYYHDATPDRLFLVTSFFLIVCDLIMILLINSLMLDQQKRKEAEQLSYMLEAKAQHYEDQQAKILELNKMQHDMKKHLDCIQGLSDNEQIHSYITSITSQMQQYALCQTTKNVTMDIMIARTNLECAKKGLTLIPIVDSTGFESILPKDLCVILANALDNACEAAALVIDKEKHEIILRIGKHMEFLMIRVENAFEHSLKRDADGKFKTSKEDKMQHGFGLKSIQSTVESYGGEVVIETKQDRFLLTILIPAAVKIDKEM